MEIEFQKEADSELFLEIYTDGKQVDGMRFLYEKRTEADMIDMMQFLVQHNICIRRLEMHEPTLETLFMEVVGK